jgi:catalase-peroxidase
MILAGNVALESMGFKTFGFAGGRADVWEPESSTGARGHLARRRALQRRARALEAARRGADGPHLRQPGRPERQSRSAAAARDIRETFARMAMNDEETVALIAGGHTFGKTHGAGDPSLSVPSRKAPAIEDQGLGWKSTFTAPASAHAITSGLEVTWTTTPTKWSNNFFENLFGYEWELTKSPAGAKQWTPKGAEAPRCPMPTTRRRSIARRC